MSSHTSTGRQPVDFNDWMRSIERRLIAQERRPQNVLASIGPGLAPHAVLINDWNSEEASFDGFFYSESNSLNSPDLRRRWIGVTIGNDDSRGLQRVSTFSDDSGQLFNAWPGVSYVRAFTTPDGTLRVYTPWKTETQYWYMFLSGDQTITTTSTTVLGTLTQDIPVFGDDEVYQVTLSLNLTHNGTGTRALNVELALDGSAVSSLMLYNAGAIDGLSVSASKTWIVTGMPSGTRTLAARARLSNTPDSYTVQGFGSTMSIVRLV